jgi:hypothetical protein
MEWIGTGFTKLRMRCTQEKCPHFQDTQDRKVGGSGNLIRHYESKHKSIPATEKAEKELQPRREVQQADFFQPRYTGEKDQKMR